MRVRFSRPSLAQQALARPEAVAVVLLLGLLLADSLRMIPWYLRYMAWAVGQLGWDYEGAVAAAIIAIALASLAVSMAVAALSGREGFWPRVRTLGLALLPLALATQLALSAQHLMAIGEVLRSLGAEAGLLQPGHMPPANAYSVVWPMKVLQISLLVGAAALSLRTTLRRPGGWRSAPTLLVAVLTMGLLAIFLQPMSVTC